MCAYLTSPRKRLPRVTAANMVQQNIVTFFSMRMSYFPMVHGCGIESESITGVFRVLSGVIKDPG